MTGVSTLGQALNRISLIEDQNILLNTLTNQLATGKLTQKYSGLQTDILTSKRSRADVQAIDIYTNNIDRANRRIELMLGNIEEFQAQTQILWDLMIGFGQEGLHDNNADVVYGEQTIAGNVDLSVTTLGALGFAPPNDQLIIGFRDPNDPTTSQNISVDLTAAALLPGNADTQLANAINAAIAAVPLPASFNATAVSTGTTVNVSGTTEIIFNTSGSSSISAIELASLGFSAGGSSPPEIGLSTAQTDIELTTLQNSAEDIFTFLTEILNTQESGRYVLGGADTLTQPVTNNGVLDADVSSLLQNWKSGALATNDDLISAFRSRTVAEDANAITDTTIGYSAALAANNAGDVFVRVAESSEIEYTALANEQPFRDILVATAFVKNADFVPVADVYADPYTPGDPTTSDGAPGANLDEMQDNFYAIFNELTTMLNQAIDDVDQIRFRLEADRARLAEIKSSYIDERALLQDTISSVEDADLNSVAIQIQTLQVQLEASYSVTARVSELTLVNFLR